jgi:hypothetical protein
MLRAFIRNVTARSASRTSFTRGFASTEIYNLKKARLTDLHGPRADSGLFGLRTGVIYSLYEPRLRGFFDQGSLCFAEL